MKKKFMLTSMGYILVVSLLCGCSIIERVKSTVEFGDDIIDAFTTDEKEEYTVVLFSDVDKEADRITQLVYEAIKTKDGKALKEVFSTYTAQEHNLDKEIKVFFNKIKGKVISVEEINGYGSSGSKDAMKGDVLNRYVGDIINLKTDKGYSYHVSILGVYNYVGFEEKVGVSNIYLNYSDKCDYDDKLAEIGEY